MNAYLDDSLVALILLACSLYVIATLGPSAARRRVLAMLARLLARAPMLRLRSAGRRLAGAADKTQGACGGCDNCGSEPRPHARGTDIAIPIAAIRRARTTLAPAVRTSRQE
jgi:hypothetical protein